MRLVDTCSRHCTRMGNRRACSSTTRSDRVEASLNSRTGWPPSSAKWGGAGVGMVSLSVWGAALGVRVRLPTQRSP